MDDLVRKLSDLVEQKKGEHLEFLRELVRAETTDGNERNGQNLIISRLRRLPCELDVFDPDPEIIRQYEDYNEGHEYRDRPNVVAVFKGNGGGRSLLLNGHIDTVFPGAPEQWTSPPWEPRVEGNRLYGLGSCDMKAGLAALVLAMELVTELHVPLRGDVILESVVDEEAGGGNGTLACIARGYRADAALVAEPTGLVPMSSHMGSVAFKVTFQGVPSHSNIKCFGVNAIEKALPFLNGLRALETKWQAQQQHPLLPKPIVSINRITAGEGPVLVPAVCDIEVNFTYVPGWESCLEEVRQLLREIADADEWLTRNPPVLEWIHHVRPYDSDPMGDWQECVRTCVSEVLRKCAAIKGFPTGADARLIANISGVPTVILGPGDIRRAHSTDEYVELDQFYHAILIYALSVIRWAS